MVQIDVRYQGELRCEALHGPSRAVLTTDAPLDNRGRGEAFSPTDLVATALGTCMLTIMGIAAQERGWDMQGSRARVTKHMRADPARRIAKLEVEIDVAGRHDARARAVLERAALSCPVHRALSASVEIPLVLRWEEPS